MISFMALMFVCAVFSACIAAAKGRSFIGWLILGFCFPVISLLALIALPARAASDGRLNLER